MDGNIKLEANEERTGGTKESETDNESREFMIDFALPSWYHKFKAITIKSVFLDLPEEFVEYLTSDGCTLPAGCSLPSFPRQPQSEGEESGGDWSDEDEENEAPPSFPGLVTALSAAIESLGSASFPKLNWSSPMDARWVSGTGTLCCSTPAEVILLLKSSDFISHDLSLVSEINSTKADETPPLQCTLCLREWQDITPSSEFRCFMRDRQLVGVSQRSVHTHFPYLLPLRDQLKAELQEFTDRILSDTHLTHCVYDVYRRKQGDYLLVDFNPFSPPTDPLLFNWEELHGWAGPVEVRLVEDGCVQPSPLHVHRLPQDFVDLSTGADIHKFVDLFYSKGLGST